VGIDLPTNEQEYGDEGRGFRVQGSGFRVPGSEFRVRHWLTQTRSVCSSAFQAELRTPIWSGSS
jgi:hypothetical protein